MEDRDYISIAKEAQSTSGKDCEACKNAKPGQHIVISKREARFIIESAEKLGFIRRNEDGKRKGAKAR